jgi:cytochrome c556
MKRVGIFLVGALVVAATLPMANREASAGAPDIVAQRQALMKQMGFAMRDAGAFLNPQTPYDAAKVREEAQVLVDAGRKLPGLFPPDSLSDPKTAADPKILQNRDDFTRRLEDLAKLASQARTAGTAEDLKPSFVAIGGACKSCHDTYRKKKS